MTSRLTLILALVTALAVAGCGAATTETSAPASSSSDVNALLKDTFVNAKDIKSADLEMKLSANGQGQAVSATLGGPYESQGAGKLPKFQWNAALNSGGKSFTGGVTWTGDKGYVTVQGTPYELSGMVADEFKAGYEQSLKDSQGKSSSGNAALLGIDFSKWLKNPRNAGDAQAGGVDAIEITGDADIAQVIDDLQKVSKKAASLNLPGTQQVPTQLTAQERQQILDAVKKLSVQIYTGKADKLLRRVVVNADLVDPSTKSAATATFDFTLNKVNQGQSIQAPANPKPFSDLSKLAEQLKGTLGGLALGSGSGSSSGSGGGSTSPSAVPSSANIDKYAKCIEQAKGDTSKAQKCADLLTG